MARSSSESFAPIVMAAVVGVGVWLLSKRQVPAGRAVVGYDAFGNPVYGSSSGIAPIYGQGSLAAPAYGQADTIPNIINAFGNLIGQTAAAGGGLQPATPVGLTDQQASELTGLF